MFQPLCAASGLTLGLASAQRSLAVEAAALTSTGHAHLSASRLLPSDSPLSLMGNAGGGTLDAALLGCLLLPSGGAGLAAVQCVDVLVATPGRLVAHLQGTPGFTLKHLRCAWGGHHVQLCTSLMRDLQGTP